MFNLTPQYDAERDIIFIGVPSPFGFTPLIGFYNWDRFGEFLNKCTKFYEENRTKVPEVYSKAFKDDGVNDNEKTN